MWREETRASPGLLLFSDGLLEEKLDLSCLVKADERRERPWLELQGSGLGDTGLGQRRVALTDGKA